MPRPSITWLITDTHFFHDRMIELCNRPADFNERIMTNLRYLVAEQDNLIHFGDVIFYHLERLKPMLDSVPSRSKILVMGNHDKKKRGWYERNGFSFACDSLVLGNVLLSHKPMRVFPDGVRMNIHGHHHNLGDRISESSDFWKPETHRLLALEHTGYKPVNLQSFLAGKNS